MSTARPRQRDRVETRRHLSALKAREAWLDHQVEAGRIKESARSRTIGERNALRFAIALAERWIGEGGEDDL